MTTTLRNRSLMALALVLSLGLAAGNAAAQRQAPTPELQPTTFLTVNGLTGAADIMLRTGDKLSIDMKYAGGAPAYVLLLAGRADGYGGMILDTAIPLFATYVDTPVPFRHSMYFTLPSLPEGAYAFQFGSANMYGRIERTDVVTVKFIP